MVLRRRRAFIDPPSRPRRRRRARRGVAVSSLLVFAIPMFGLAIGLGLELALINTARERVQSAADAAALAAAAELFDPDSIRIDVEAVLDASYQRANAAALLYTRMNLGRGPELPTFAKSPLTVLFAHVPDPTDYASPLAPVDVDHPCNTAVVVVERTRRKRNAVPLILGPLLGLIPGDVAATARGTLDRRVYGVRPIGDVPAPLMPFAAGAAAWRGATADAYTVDPKTGATTAGPDGVPEVALAVPLPGGLAAPGDALAPLDLSSDRSMSELIAQGIRTTDLAATDGELALDNSGLRTVPCRAQAESSLVAALAQTYGVNRVWPLYEETASPPSSGRVTLVDFAAGRVVLAEVDGATQHLRLTVQPSVYPTSCALVRPGPALNRHVAKLGLTR